ncbi:putative uncharacterized protein [Bacteroides sp. CAG:144]|jgi:hypothetical protein|nr:hypothetical protein [Coprobacter sp.]CDA22455.1 putative uncharacterized protein [Bacteroides sp. CAG:144]
MTVHTFLAHFIYGEKGLTGQHLLHVDTLHHTIALSPYEKETAGTRFCDGILFVANASFEVCKPQIIAELKAQNIFTLSALASYLSDSSTLLPFCKPPISRLYAIIPSPSNKEIYLQEILSL